MSGLADRIRGIVTPGPPGAKGPTLSDLPAPYAFPDLVTALGGAWRGGCFVVERQWDPAARHGHEAVGTLAACLEEGSGDAVLFTGGAPAHAPFVFFDLETTGLSGGAGTQAFLVGCARFEADGSFVTRQFLLTQCADERPLLETVAAELTRAGTLVSFNGKSFDMPLLETRYLFHRLPWNARDLPHVDVLHPARRFWKKDVDGGCSLVALERQIVGVRRAGDVPGFEIPARYFQFVRSGDARPLAAVLDHNRRDLLTLAALTARLMHLARTGPEQARDAREALALGRVYARGGLDERARSAYAHAIERCRSPRRAYDPIRIEALRLLAFAWRRARRYEEAADCWSELLEIRGSPPLIEREAIAALAIHHEHRRRDPQAAKAFALRSLESAPAPAWRDAAQYRLARLERKMSSAQQPALLSSPSWPRPSCGSQTSGRRTSS